ncbi:MAG TPA: ATP-binding protein [Methylomusa anaerophila]|uniref:histidine kinase n=1 Tax=Methylomusa anaerophila TaxID=1930071 RepID=A0A348ALR2_9FIRM|nr:ATP-binding protein [Methylomusa anaerophila]BBB92010.1 phytochrome-like protein cph1 [Methylomusa anaerophila]HML87978.1 ATP-binding protein [Methylomusa anaerophila]
MGRPPAYMPFVKAAQYLSNVRADQDFKSELYNVVANFFQVDVVAVAAKNPDGKVTFHDCRQDNGRGADILLEPAVEKNVLDVMDTGLFKQEKLTGPPDITLFFIPVEVAKKTTTVLIIGHYNMDPPEIKSHLNEYLAVARLAGSVQSRIICERENIERKSNEKFRLLFHRSCDPILLLDEAGCIIECNEASLQALGAKSKELVYRKLLSSFAPKYQPDGQVSSVKETQLLSEVIETGDVQFEWLVRRPDGTEVIVDAKLSTVLMDGAKVQLVHWRDITERKLFEEKLKYLNAELENKMHELQDVNAALEEEISERQAMQEALGQLNVQLDNRVQERTRELQDINAMLEEEIMERQAAQEALGKMNTNLENKVKERTRELQNINAMLEEEIMERQAAQEALVRSRDSLITRETQLRHYAAELVNTNKELRDFANIVAHDFRTPMVNLKGFSQELDHSLADLKQILKDQVLHFPEKFRRQVNELLDRDVPEALTYIHSSVDRLDRMVAALLRLARLGRREMIYHEVDIGKLINTVLQSFYHQIEKKNIHIEIGPMPQIETDHLAIEQIMANLLDNAIKYLASDRRGEISVACTDNGSEYMFSVKDNGRGIAAADREKIFEIFRRSGTQDLPGEGMGLAYVRTLIRHLGGRLWCESELGIGTKMNFTVPKSPFVPLPGFSSQ